MGAATSTSTSSESTSSTRKHAYAMAASSTSKDTIDFSQNLNVIAQTLELTKGEKALRRRAINDVVQLVHQWAKDAEFKLGRAVRTGSFDRNTAVAGSDSDIDIVLLFVMDRPLEEFLGLQKTIVNALAKYFQQETSIKVDTKRRWSLKCYCHGIPMDVLVGVFAGATLEEQKQKLNDVRQKFVSDPQKYNDVSQQLQGSFSEITQHWLKNTGDESKSASGDREVMAKCSRLLKAWDRQLEPHHLRSSAYEYIVAFILKHIRQSSEYAGESQIKLRTLFEECLRLFVRIDEGNIVVSWGKGSSSKWSENPFSVVEPIMKSNLNGGARMQWDNFVRAARSTLQSRNASETESVCNILLFPKNRARGGASARFYR